MPAELNWQVYTNKTVLPIKTAACEQSPANNRPRTIACEQSLAPFENLCLAAGKLVHLRRIADILSSVVLKGEISKDGFAAFFVNVN
jgi:hypothetical protein